MTVNDPCRTISASMIPALGTTSIVFSRTDEQGNITRHKMYEREPRSASVHRLQRAIFHNCHVNEGVSFTPFMGGVLGWFYIYPGAVNGKPEATE